MKRFFSVILSAVMVVMTAFPAFAATEAEKDAAYTDSLGCIWMEDATLDTQTNTAKVTVWVEAPEATGFWAYDAAIFYPSCLSMTEYENGTITDDEDALIAGQMNSVKLAGALKYIFQDPMNEDIISAYGIELVEGGDWYGHGHTVAYDSLDENFFGSGSAEIMTFSYDAAKHTDEMKAEWGNKIPVIILREKSLDEYEYDPADGMVPRIFSDFESGGYLPGGTFIETAWIHLPSCQHTNCETEKVEPTCTVGGSSVTTCLDCGSVVSRKTLSALGHDYSVEIGTVEASCSNDGYTGVCCSRCGEYKKTDTIASTGHSVAFVERVAPTCTEDGFDLYKCSKCSLSEKKNIIPATGHDISVFVKTVSATCESIKYDEYKCKGCSLTEQRKTGDALGHSYSFIKTVSASQNSDGYDEYKCSVCSKVEKRNIIPANSIGVIVTSSASASKGTSQVSVKVKIQNNPGIWGTNTLICYDSALTLSSVSSAGGVFAESDMYYGTKNVSSSSLPSGSNYKAALAELESMGISTSGKKFAVVNAFTSASGNNTSSGDYLNLKFSTSSVAAGTYQVMAYAYPKDTINFSGDSVYFVHEPGYITITACSHNSYTSTKVAPTCTTPEYTVYTCTVCSAKKTVYGDYNTVLGHDYSVAERTVDATCTSQGYTVYGCTRCSSAQNRDFTKAVSHSFEIKHAPDNICTMVGFITYRCTDCGLENTVTSSALGHDITNVIEVVEPTCITAGYEIVFCRRCNDNIKIETSSALGHTRGEEIKVTSLACEEKNIFVTPCTHCATILEKTEVAGRHIYSDEFTVDIPATETSVGSKSRHCLYCDAVTDVTEIPMLDPVTKGDVDGNGRINIFDILAFKKYISDTYTGNFVEEAADITDDGRINIIDLRRLKKIIGGD